MSNVPDDWNCYWTTCSRCGNRYHASEGGCACEDYCSCGEELEDGKCPECDPVCAKCGLDAEPIEERDGKILCGPCAEEYDVEHYDNAPGQSDRAQGDDDGEEDPGDSLGAQDGQG